jgi:penicillin amidase
VPGTPEHEWHGVVPPGELPRLVNPDSGLVITANQRIVGDDFPHYLGLDYARSDRARRLHERLDGIEDATVDDMAAVHRDTRSLAADVWVAHLVGLVPRDEWERASIDRLRAWDRTMERESVAAAIYVVTRDAVCRRLAHDPRLVGLRAPLPDEPSGTFQPLELRLWALSTGLLDAGDTTLLPDRTWPDVLAAALTEAVSILRTGLGDDVEAWRWGALHVARPRHPLGAATPVAAAHLDPPSVEMAGEWDTVMCAAHPAGHGYGVSSTSVARYVFDLADWDRSAWIVPLGASGDATSPHFADQQSAWAQGELVPMRYSWGTIEEHATTRTRLHA